MKDLGEMIGTSGTGTGTEKKTETETEMTTETENTANAPTLAPTRPVDPIAESTTETTTDVGTEREKDTHLRRGAAIITLVADIDWHNLTHITPARQPPASRLLSLPLSAFLVKASP